MLIPSVNTHSIPHWIDILIYITNIPKKPKYITLLCAPYVYLEDCVNGKCCQVKHKIKGSIENIMRENNQCVSVLQILTEHLALDIAFDCSRLEKSIHSQH